MIEQEKIIVQINSIEDKYKELKKEIKDVILEWAKESGNTHIPLKNEEKRVIYDPSREELAINVVFRAIRISEDQIFVDADYYRSYNFDILSLSDMYFVYMEIKRVIIDNL